MLLDDYEGQPGEDSNRRIELTMSGGEEKTKTIYIGTGSEAVEELTGGANDGSWDSLKANNLYKITVTGSATEEEEIPAIGPGTTIRICWIPNYNGLKFYSTIRSTHLFSDNKVNKNEEIRCVTYNGFATAKGYIDGISIGYYVYSDFKLDNQIYKNIVYAIIDSDTFLNTDLPKIRNLSKDVIGKPKENSNNIVELWLTSIDIYHYLGTYNFPTDHKYRLYINKEEDIKYGFTIKTSNGEVITEKSDNVSNFSYNNKRDYYYYDFSISTSVNKIDLIIYDITGNQRKELIKSGSYGVIADGIYREEIDGEIYYVIYAN